MLCLLLCNSSSFVTLMHAKKTGAELAGSWTTEIGSQDEAGNKIERVHTFIWHAVDCIIFPSLDFAIV